MGKAPCFGLKKSHKERLNEEITKTDRPNVMFKLISGRSLQAIKVVFPTSKSLMFPMNYARCK